jgi:hypothetical protein
MGFGANTFLQYAIVSQGINTAPSDWSRMSLCKYWDKFPFIIVDPGCVWQVRLYIDRDQGGLTIQCNTSNLLRE